MEQDDCDVPDLLSSSESELDDEIDDNDDFEDEEEMNLLTGDVKCLFCEEIQPSVNAILSHCKGDHHFDIVALCQRWAVDCVNYIKMINFCRKELPNAEQVIQGLMSGGVEWCGDEFMHAVDVSDLMLQFDIESMVSSLPLRKSKDAKNHDFSNNFVALDSNQSVQSSEAIAALTARVKAAEEHRDMFKKELDRALEDMERLKLSGQQMILKMAGDVKENPCKQARKSTTLSDEDGYFASYSHHGIHMSMLKDEVRTRSYQDFMLLNPNLFEGKTVLDVGCGTGILSMFAVKAGAKQVVAVDSSQIIYQAMDIARENNMHEKITFVKGRLEDVTLPLDKFDVIISEWMGYFLLFEAMLDSVLWARDRYLSVDGGVYPDYFTMKVVGISDPQLYQQTVGYWDDVYGFKMSCMKQPVWEEVQVCTVSGENIVTEPSLIKEINVSRCQVSDLDFESDFNLVCLIDTELTALVGYFDTYFMHNCLQKINFSTGPKSVKTHWEQAVMMLPKPLPVKKGVSMACHISYKKHPYDERGVIINLTLGQLKLKYSLA